MEIELRNLSDLSGGYLHRADVLALGGSDDLIRSFLRMRVLQRIRVGTYAFVDEQEQRTPEARHLVLARSVIDKFPHGSVALSHHSAAVAHGAGVYGVDLSTVHVVRLDGASGRIESGIVHHSVRPRPDDLVMIDGRWVTSAPRAVWEVACAAGPRGGLVVMDSALHHGIVLPEHLIDAAGRYAPWPGSRAARLTVHLADGGAATPAESLLRYVCFENHLPRPETQVEVRDEDDRFVAFTDLGWIEHRHHAEVDGRRKYVRDLAPGEDAGEVVYREKIREDRIRALDRGMTRATWSEVQPEASRSTGARLAHDLEQSHRLYARARRHL